MEALMFRAFIFLSSLKKYLEKNAGKNT